MGLRLPHPPNLMKGATALAKGIYKYSGAQQMGSDAYWAATHPIDRLTGKGRAANQTMMYPGPLGGAGAMIALGPGSSYRRKLMEKLGGTIPARMALDRADASMLLMRNEKPGEDFLKLFSPYSGEAKPGGRYTLPATNKQGAYVDDRVAIIQDPKTGTMFAAPNALHGDLMDYVHDNIPGFPASYPKWFQHELYNATPELNAPARLMHGLDPRKDTELATYSRAKLIGKLRDVGIKVDKATKAPSYRQRLAAPSANKAMADMLAEVLKKSSKHKR